MRVNSNVLKVFCFNLVVLFVSSCVYASDIDILIDKLVEKNILSRSDAQEIVSEIQKEKNMSKEIS
ncbi:hypothetical protein KKC59_02725 [bacterium]|nr:hypothetical protein [bacterium]